MRRSFSLWTCSALLVGCAAVGPDYEAPSVPTPSAWSQPPSSAAAVALGQWWSAFADAELDSLVGRALASNLDLELARARLDEARAALGIARSAQLPQVGLGVGYDRTRRSTQAQGGAPFFGKREVGAWDAGFDASWELDVFGGVRRQIEAAVADAQSLDEARRATLASVSAEVARSYVELRALQQRLAVAQQRIAVQSETAEIVGLRADAGVASDLDSTRARAQVASARSEVPSLQAQIAVQVHRLSVLLGAEPRALEEELQTPGEIPNAQLELAIDQPLDVLERRPDVRQAERACAAASARVAAAVSDLFPSFTLGANFGWRANELGDLLHSSAVAASVGPRVSLPLFDGGARRAQVDAASAREEQALATHHAVVLGALEDVENSLANLAAATERRATLRDAVREQQQAAVMARDLYTGGVVDFLEVLDAERERFALEDSLLQVERDVSVGFIALAKALGGGWSEPQAELAAAKR